MVRYVRGSMGVRDIRVNRGRHKRINGTKDIYEAS